jgi:RsiW-degrading membrane proteinase PrsW (M82 family)
MKKEQSKSLDQKQKCIIGAYISALVEMVFDTACIYLSPFSLKSCFLSCFMVLLEIYGRIHHNHHI